MDLSRKCKEFWGVTRLSCDPFGKRIEAGDGLFVWPAFEEAVEAIVEAILRRQFLAVVGVACSAKTTAWTEACRRMPQHIKASAEWHCCQPRGLDIKDYNEINIYRAVKETILPFDGSRETAFRRDREARGRQLRQLLEQQNENGNPVCLSVNDAHDCRPGFLTMCKRVWDDLYGFDRLLSIILIGQPGLMRMVAQIPEISERSEVVRMAGLGDHLEPYLHHELARCGVEHWPFDDSAVAELRKLAGPNWLNGRDHPLMVNNIVSRAMYEGWRIKQTTIDATLIAESIRAERAMV